MGNPLSLTRLNITKPDAGILRIVSGASVTIYDTNSDGTSPVTPAGEVSPGAVKSVLYADRDKITTKSNPLIADNQGLVEFYVDKIEIHVLVVALDGTTYGTPWYAVPYTPQETIATNYSTLQDAVNDTPEGGILRIGPGTYIVPSGGLLISKAIEIAGSGSRYTILKPFSDSSNQPVIKFLAEQAATDTGPTSVNNVYIHDLEIRGLADDPDNAPDRAVGSHGIYIAPYASGHGQRIRDVFIERVNINHMGDSGLYVTGDGGLSCVIGLRISSCQFNQNWGFGQFIKGATMVFTSSVLCSSNYLDGGRFESCNPTCFNDYYEDNCHSNDGGLTINGYNAQVSFFAGVVSVMGVTVEAFTKVTGSTFLRQPITKTGMSFNQCTGFVGGCRFYNAVLSGVVDERGIFIDNKDGKSALLVGPNQFDRLYIAVSTNSDGSSNGTVKTTVLPQRIFGGDGFITQSSGMAVTAVNSTERSAALDGAAKGQLVFNTTTNKLNVWNGSAWEVVTSV